MEAFSHQWDAHHGCVRLIEHTIGFEGANLEIIARLTALTDGGRRHFILTADFNVDPRVWEESGLLEKLGMRIITAGNFGTCKIKNGFSQLDYILATHEKA